MTADPDWTFEEALAEHERELALDPSRFADPTMPFPQWGAFRDLVEYRKRFEDGDRYALMTAIRICANHDLPLPGWVSKAFIHAYDTVTNARSKSWNEVFGSPYPKGTNLNALKKKRELRFAVHGTIIGIVKTAPDTPIDSHLFEKVGSKFNIGKTLAEEYYREACGILDLSAVDVKKRLR